MRGGLRQALDQRAVREILLDGVARHLDQAEAFEGRGPISVGSVDRQDGGQCHGPAQPVDHELERQQAPGRG